MPTPHCPVCSDQLAATKVQSPFTSCPSCSKRLGHHVYRQTASEFSAEGSMPGDPMHCIACRGFSEPENEGVHCARIVSGIVPSAFPRVEPPYLDVAPAWMGGADRVMKEADGWAGMEGALSGLTRVLSSYVAEGAVAHVALFDGLDDATNQSSQLIAVFLVTSEALSAPVLETTSRVMATLGLRPQGQQAMVPVSPVPIAFSVNGVIWRAWVEVGGAPLAYFLDRSGSGAWEWAGTREWLRVEQICGVRDGDLVLVNF